MKISIIMPARNESGHIKTTLCDLACVLKANNIDHEIIVINDHSSDDTEKILSELKEKNPTISYFNNQRKPGFGEAVHFGLEKFTSEAAIIVMADGSDAPEDVVKYYKKLQEGYECVFGSRFIKGSRLVDYPFHKLMLNRFGNWFIKTLFNLRYNDVSNAFKAYHRRVIDGLRPIISCHFNLTVELPLKAIVRGYTYAVVPINWYNRKAGISKWKIKEMGSRYLFIVLYVLLEKHLSRGDYIKKDNYLSK